MIFVFLFLLVVGLLSLFPILCGFVDIWSWLVLGYGISPIDWGPLQVLLTFFFVPVGLKTLMTSLDFYEEFMKERKLKC